MDIDSPPPSSGGASPSSSSSSSSAASFSASSVSSHDRILQRLAVFGVPEDYFEDLHPGLVCFVKSNKSLLPEIVSTILPNDADIASAVNEGTSGSRKALDCLNLRDQYREGMLWLKWLMFEGDPNTALNNLANSSAGQRGVCGAVWGKNDLAFRCRTCEHDPTCAICVPCFQNGNHENHDYSIIYTGGGCCDCGDETAWKCEGFCSKHKGAEQIVPLADEIASSVGPVLDILLKCWKGKLMHAEAMSRESLDVTDHSIEPRKVANGFSYAVIEMLLDFCCHSESLLSFVAKRIIITADLLNLLVRAERFLSNDVTKKLHELLLKLLAEPMFKYEFAKVFIDYYPVTVAEVLKASTDILFRKYPLLSTFSVQIFTVPTLTPRLVKERNLLAVLLECFGDILLCCCGEEGQFQFNKWASVFDTCTRVVEDIKFVLSHSDVAKYVTCERPDILKAWLQTVSLMQGINSLKRETGIHIEEDNEHVHLPFLMCDSVSKIHLLLVKSAFSVSSIANIEPKALKEKKEDIDEGFNQRHAKVGRLSGESSVCNSAAHNSLWDFERRRLDHSQDYILEPTVLKLTFELLRVIDSWLARSNIFSSGTDWGSNVHLLALKETLLALKKGKHISGPSDVPCGIGKLHSCTGGSQALACSPMDAGDLQCDSIMETELPIEKDIFSLLSLSEWPDIDYDVSSQEISLHIPLHWLLSTIFKVALQNLFGEAVEMRKHVSNHPNPMFNRRDFFQSMMKGCHPSAFSSFIMEHPLQNRVFCSQMRAGMWRRNGDNAVSCLDWYRAIRWSGHELEEDLFLLQLCAAFAPADLYAKRLLQRFQLSNYLVLDLKRTSEYEPVLIQELLTLIIQIVQERRFCGLTASENLQRELISKLATGDATRSQLVKSLPKDLSKLDILQEVLDRIAEYSNPSGLNQGKYSLRLPFWKHLDLYHPCSNLRELQIAEERYSRFCGVSALSTQLPRWTNIYQPLIGIARLATCETVLHVIRAVIFFAVFTDRSTDSRAPDGVLITALHLLSLALDICTLEKESGLSTEEGDFISPMVDVATEDIEMLKEFSQQSLLSLLVLLMKMHKKGSADSLVETGNFSLSSLVEKLLKKFAEVDSKCLMKLQQLAPEVVSCQAAEKLNLSSVSDMEKRKMKARERQAAILAKMKAEQSKFLATLKSTDSTASDDSRVEKEERVPEDVEETGETHVCCLCHDPNSSNAVSFLIVLQKSRLVNFVNNGPPSWDRDWQSDWSESSRRAMVNPLGKYSNKIPVEALSSSELFQIIEGAVNEFARQAHSAEVDAFIEYTKHQFPEMRNLNVPGKSSDKRDTNVYSLETLEKDMFLSVHKELSSFVHDSDLRTDGRYLCSTKEVVTSGDEDTLLLGKYIATLTKDSNPSDTNNSRRVESSGKFFSYDGYGPSDCDGIHVSSCGHAVHQGCLDRYLSSLKDRYIRRMVFEGGDIVDPDQGEFLCPVCRRLANSTLPAFVEDSSKHWEQSLDIISSSRSLIDTEEERGSLRLSYAMSMLQSATAVVSKGETLKALPVQRRRRILPNLVPVYQLLGQMYFPGKQDDVTESARVSPSVLLWDTLKYSLVSTEIAARCGKSCLTARRGIHSLYNEFRSSGGFILPLLLRTIKSVRNKSLSDLLLRFRGLQHFAASICLGVGYGKGLGGASGQEGKIWSMLKYSNSDMFPDMQFWGRASDPVLTRDPFSTLMWILFCLPFPFLSCKESVLSLIHLFYGVAVCQAIITYCSHSQCNVLDFGSLDCLISDIANLAGESAITKQFFFSNHVDPSYSVKHVINNLSLPYLRRCSLLWKLLYSPGESPFPSVREDIGKSASNGHVVGGDMDEICELQNLFNIPPLDIVLQDKNLRSMVVKWFHHFANGFEDSAVQAVLYSMPSTPFRLMNLPLVYQDLVQRYIKAQCPDCKAVQGEPALCLLCGRLCSPAWKPCCRDNGCQAHSLACGAGTGVFLFVRKTTILLQRNARQAPWPSLYLDVFGEEDIDMQRGKPLFLNEERYAALTYMVASHGIDRSSKVLRQTRIGTLFLV